jgi:hypothetical protein
MHGRFRKIMIGVALLAAFALGGSAVANALSDNSTSASGGSSPSSGSSSNSGSSDDARPDNMPQRQDEELLTGSTATSVREAALAKVPGGTIERVETDADGNAAYEAHMTASDGSRVTVYVNKQFEVVSVDDSPGHMRGTESGDQDAA